MDFSYEQDERLTSAECAVPDQLGSDTECARDAEKNSIVLHLRETIVSQESARVRIHIGPGVLCFARLYHHT